MLQTAGMSRFGRLSGFICDSDFSFFLFPNSSIFCENTAIIRLLHSAVAEDSFGELFNYVRDCKDNSSGIRQRNLPAQIIPLCRLHRQIFLPLSARVFVVSNDFIVKQHIFFCLSGTDIVDNLVSLTIVGHLPHHNSYMCNPMTKIPADNIARLIILGISRFW